jgi:hypothetical protein
MITTMKAMRYPMRYMSLRRPWPPWG